MTPKKFTIVWSQTSLFYLFPLALHWQALKIILPFPGDIFSKDALSSYTETMENH